MAASTILPGNKWRLPQKNDLTPRPYQDEGADRIVSGWKRFLSGDRRASHLDRMAAGLATGLGKTHLAAMVVERAGNAGVIDYAIFIAHQTHLVEGGYRKMVKHFPVLDVGYIGKFEGKRHDTIGRHITVISLDSLNEKRMARLMRQLKGKRVALLLDEMHHATPDNKWGRCIEAFREAEAPAAVLFAGFSATIERTDKVPFGWLLEDESCVAVEMDIAEGTRQGYLAPIVLYSVSFLTESAVIQLDDSGEATAESIDKIVNLPESREQFFQQWSELCPDRQMVGFCSSIQAAVEWAEFYRSKGISATWVASNTKAHPIDGKERKRRLDGLASGKIQCLFNPCLLTEGFDHAPLGTVALLGACKSRVRLTQMVGRGTRIVGFDIEASRKAGKADCIVLDAVGAAKAGLVRAVDLRTAKEKGEGDGEDDEEKEEREPGFEGKSLITTTVTGSEIFQLDIYSGNVTCVRWRGLRIAPLSEGRAAVVLPGIDPGFICVYAQRGKGMYPTRFDRLEDALDYLGSNLHSGSDVWLPKRHDDGEEDLTKKRISRPEMDMMQRRGREIGIDVKAELEKAPSVVLWRAIMGALDTLIELRAWLSTSGPWDPAYPELEAIYQREISREVVG